MCILGVAGVIGRTVTLEVTTYVISRGWGRGCALIVPLVAWDKPCSFRFGTTYLKLLYDMYSYKSSTRGSGLSRVSMAWHGEK